LLPCPAFRYHKPVSKSRRWIFVLLLTGLVFPRDAQAQIDPEHRSLFQLGFGFPLEGKAPIPGYAFFYYNKPDLVESNLALRLAVAPVYLDSELGFVKLLGEHTDFGLGLAGGGFADSYYEVRQGKFLQEESFTGHGGTISGNVYHLFNPGQLIPLNGLMRGEFHYATYERDGDTAPTFVVPNDVPAFAARAGFRWGGSEPVLSPDLAMEISAWYQGQFRLKYGPYGFNGDREIEAQSHLFWGRALLAYTFPQSKINFLANLTGGSSLDADRFSAYRLGGLLPLASEFPLSLPGYYYQEISARRFALLNGRFNFPLGATKRWAINAVGSVGVVDYLPGLEQPGKYHSGVGGGLSYRASSEAWQILLDYGYGFNAIRSHGSGAQSIGLLIQWNPARTPGGLYNPGSDSVIIRGLDSFLHSFN
jgi:hypothetical protein